MLTFSPPSPFLGSIVVRTVLVWAFLRFMTAALGTFAEIPFLEGLAFSPLRFLWITAFVAGAVFADLRLHRENVFLANLGVSLWQILGLITLLCGGFEFLLWAWIRG